jgi:hypothetical protein
MAHGILPQPMASASRPLADRIEIVQTTELHRGRVVRQVNVLD